MEYLDDLDEAAMAALCELDASEYCSAYLYSSTPVVGFKKECRYRRLQPIFLLKLDGPISTPHVIAAAAGLLTLPKITTALGELERAEFCYLEQPSLSRLEDWLSRNHPTYRSIKVKLAKAHKDSSPPTLGVDPTLPFHRPIIEVSPRAMSERYPIWYFFYGTLADSETLAHVLDLPDGVFPELIPAAILDGAIKIWEGKYKALVDKPGATVDGFAYQVASVEQEDVLRIYETENYEVVRAKIELNENGGNHWVRGYTFRFSGFVDDLC